LGNVLKPGEIACENFTFANYGASVMEGHGRLLEVIVDQPAKDMHTGNKIYFSPGTQPLWNGKN
jgi:hypothetical protein